MRCRIPAQQRVVNTSLDITFDRRETFLTVTSNLTLEDVGTIHFIHPNFGYAQSKNWINSRWSSRGQEFNPKCFNWTCYLLDLSSLLWAQLHLQFIRASFHFSLWGTNSRVSLSLSPQLCECISHYRTALRRSKGDYRVMENFRLIFTRRKYLLLHSQSGNQLPGPPHCKVFSFLP